MVIVTLLRMRHMKSPGITRHGTFKLRVHNAKLFGLTRLSELHLVEEVRSLRRELQSKLSLMFLRSRIGMTSVAVRFFLLTNFASIRECHGRFMSVTVRSVGDG